MRDGEKMKKIMLIGSRLKVTIENDWITVDRLGHDRDVGVRIPMSYCSILEFDTGPEKDSAVIVHLKMKRWARYHDIHRAKDRSRQIMMPHCVHKEENGVIKCYFTDGGLPRGMKYLLSAVEDINYEYLKLHEDNVIAIREISRTMRSLKKAWEIVDDKLASKDRGTERNGRDRIEEDQVLQHDMER